MDNGANEWQVPYSSIIAFEKMLRVHGNIACFVRSKDILFSIRRKKPADEMHVVLVNTYTFGVADYFKAKDEFPELTCITLTGDWNGYTPEVKQLTEFEGVGLFIPKELYGAIWTERPNAFFQKDARGFRIYHLRSAS